VIAGGVVIFEAAFAALGIERLRVCESSMREGLLWDLIGRAGGSDPRTASIDALASPLRRGSCPGTARGIHRADAVRSGRQTVEARCRCARVVVVGARVHEIGSGHRAQPAPPSWRLHPAPRRSRRFLRQEQQLLAAVIQASAQAGQGQLRHVAAALSPARQHTTALLRLAVLFRRARRAESLPPLRLAATSQRLRLTLPLAWFDQHPLSESDLQQEQSPMVELGLKLDLSSS
jgi:exopolyphosphatase/guanosine-5'-triphosphate,3'-diphosphate pyrophosphatase